MDNWLIYYECLKEYYNIYGNSDVPVSYKVLKNGQTLALGQWVSAQRKKYREKILHLDRKVLLDRLDFTPSVRDKKWLFMYNLTWEYYNIHGNIDIPEDYKVTILGKDYMLGRWLLNQKRNYENTFMLSRCKYNRWRLTEERIEFLEKLPIDWRTPSKKIWFLKYAKAYEYYKLHGNLIIPSDYKCTLDDGTEFSLYEWLMDNKKKYLYHKDQLSDKEIDALRKIDITRLNYYDYSWQRMYEEAKKYYKAYGNLKVPATFKYTLSDGQVIKLGNWINTQRKKYKGKIVTKEGDAISPEQINLLNKIGMIWQTNASFDVMYSYLEKYKSHYGNVAVPLDFKTNDGITYDEAGQYNLGKWLLNQRTNTVPLSKNGLKLTSLGVIWAKKANMMMIKPLCEEMHIDYEANKVALEHLSIQEFISKINYLKEVNGVLSVGGLLHPIFRMSSKDLELEYNITLEYLIKKYFRIDEVANLTLKRKR